jgi:hypothetical protein
MEFFFNFKAEKEGIAINSKFSIDNYQKYLVSEDNKVKANYLKQIFVIISVIKISVNQFDNDYNLVTCDLNFTFKVKNDAIPEKL